MFSLRSGVPKEKIAAAAADLYDRGTYERDDERVRVRLVAIGRERNAELAPAITQVEWTALLSFIWSRFRRYQRQKTDVSQWSACGRELKVRPRPVGPDAAAAACEIAWT